MKISFKNIILIDKMEFKLEDFFHYILRVLSNNSRDKDLKLKFRCYKYFKRIVTEQPS